MTIFFIPAEILDKGEERTDSPFFPLMNPHLSLICLAL